MGYNQEDNVLGFKILLGIKDKQSVVFYTSDM
jgi:hypothetical protein